MNKAIHFHIIPKSIDECIKYDYIVLGGVACKLSHIHNNISQLREVCEQARNLYNKKVYIQQPYYLEEDWDKFLQLINDFTQEQLINGVIVNCPGILKYIKDFGVEIIMSRFSIGKRKTTNMYFCDLLINNNVTALEVFSANNDLISEIKKISNLKIWVRDNAAFFNSLSNQCFINNYMKKCTNDPEQCSKGDYTLNSKDSKGSKLVTSGHFIYLEDKQKTTQQINSNEYDTIVFNSNRFEL